MPVRFRAEIQEGTGRIQDPLSFLWLYGSLETGRRTTNRAEAKSPFQACGGDPGLFRPGLRVGVQSKPHRYLRGLLRARSG